MHIRGLSAVLLVSLVLAGATACVQPHGDPQVPARAPEHSRNPVDPDPIATGDPVLLRQAMLVPDQPQAVRIQLRDERRMTTQASLTTRHSLNLDLHATLRHDGHNERGETRATLRFDRIVVTLHAIEPKELQWAYDSAIDVKKQNNSLANLMAIVADAECTLLIGPSGRLRELRGLDGRWRGAGALMAPPALLAAQWQFRDSAMRELISLALFPAMPASPVRVGDEWEITVPADLPLQARIDARLRSRLDELDDSAPDWATVCISGEAKLSANMELIGGHIPAISSIVRSGSYRVSQRVVPATHSLSQQRDTDMEVELIMTPPVGKNNQKMTVHRIFTLISTRQPGEVGAV